MIDVNEMIKVQEEKAGRPLTDKERQAIEGMVMMLGAIWNDESKPDESVV